MFTIITDKPVQRSGKREKGPSVFCRGGKLSYRMENGVSFAVLQLRSAQKPHWKAVKKKLGTSAKRVICGAGIHLPDDEDIASVDARRYSHLLTQNGLTELLKANRPTTCQKSAALIDLNCRHQEFADILVRFFRSVRIVTRNCELYERYVIQKFYECGAAILISEAPSEEDQVALYVSPEGVLFPCMEALEVPVISTEEPSAQKTLVKREKRIVPILSCFRAPTPKELDFAPADIDSHLYQAALFGCCGVGKLAASAPQQAKLGGMYKSMNELKMFLFSVDNQ